MNPLQNGTIRHILGYLGGTYAILVLFFLFGAFPVSYKGEPLGKVLSETPLVPIVVIGFIVAVVFEIAQNRKTKRYNSFSVFDLITSTIGVIIGVLLFIYLGPDWFLSLLSVAMVAFAYFDYETKFIANKTRRDL